MRKAAKKAKIDELKLKAEDDENVKEELKVMMSKKKEKKKILKKKLKKLKHSNKDEKSETKNDIVEKLKSSRFRYLNEQLYTMPSKEATELFEKDEDAFKIYHEGYRVFPFICFHISNDFFRHKRLSGLSILLTKL